MGRSYSDGQQQLTRAGSFKTLQYADSGRRRYIFGLRLLCDGLTRERPSFKVTDRMPDMRPHYSRSGTPYEP